MKPYLTLIRPSNFLITAASIFVSCILAGGTQAQLLPMLFASFGGALIGGGGMVINDIFDVEIDKINKPNRPLPSGAVTKFDASLFYAGLSVAGLMMSYYASWLAFLIALFAVPTIFFYSFWFKATPLFGNILVGTLTGLAFIYGGAAVGNIKLAMMPAIFALLINIGREVIKDMEDVEGDSKNGIATFPIKYGMRKAGMIATIFLIAVIVSTYVPFYTGLYGIKFFIAVNLGVNAVVAFVIYSLWKDQSSSNLSRLSNVLKYDMVIGLVAIYLG